MYVKNYIYIAVVALMLTACTTADSQLENKIECHEFGMKNYYEEDNDVRLYVSQEFTYNSELDTCLFYYHYIAGNVIGQGIVDMLSGDTLYFYIPMCNKGNDCSDKLIAEDAKNFDEFMTIYRKYFE